MTNVRVSLRIKTNLLRLGKLPTNIPPVSMVLTIRYDYRDDVITLQFFLVRHGVPGSANLYRFFFPLGGLGFH